MRYFFFAYLMAIVLVIGFAGFRGDRFTHTPIEIFNDMDKQAKVKGQSSNAFFADGVGSRKPVVGTVPMGLSIPVKTVAEGAYQTYGFTHGTDYYNSGRMGDFWQREYLDRYVRNAEHYQAVIAYIEENPVKAELAKLKTDWPWSSARFRHPGSAGVSPTS